MYEVVYTRNAMKDIDKIKRDEILYDEYKKKEKLIAKNPKRPDVPQGDFSAMKGGRKNGKTLYHIRLTKKHRIFYTIDEYEKIRIEQIDGNEIQFEGDVVIRQALGHDYKGHERKL